VSKSISQTNQAGSLAGNEQVLVSQLSTTVKIEGTTISAQASDQSFNDSGGGLLSAGFQVDRKVNVIGFTSGGTVNNIYSAKITALTANKMTIGGADGAVIVDASAGDTVTITQWVSARADYPPPPSSTWPQINTVTGTTDTLALTDLHQWSEYTNASGCAITVPPESSVAWPDGAEIHSASTQDTCTFVEGSGVTILVPSGFELETVTDSAWTLKKVGTNTWRLIGYLVETA